MPRSSRHKSSKHSSRDAREYSDSEKDSITKDRKGKEETSVRVSKESGSTEKRKLDSKESSKDVFGSGNGEFVEGYSSSSKRRKEKTEDGVNDRWNGGHDERGGGGEVSKKSKASGESKSKRRDDGEGGGGEEVKKSGGKSEWKHRESSRKEGREGGGGEREKEKEKEKEKERKGKEGKSEKLVNDEEHRASAKQVTEKTGKVTSCMVG